MPRSQIKDEKTYQKLRDRGESKDDSDQDEKSGKDGAEEMKSGSG